jgi:GH24 family phage-related lysozyme (muramidase)
MAQNLMDLVKLDLREDEGRFSSVKLDSKKKDKNGKIIPLYSIGIGHQVVPGDKLKPGDKIDDEREELFFHEDVGKSIAAAKRAIPNFENLPFHFQRGMVNFMFQLGANADAEWPQAFEAINRGDLQEGITQLSTVNGAGTATSKWLAKDSPKRAARTIAKLQRGVDTQFPEKQADTPTREEGTYEIEGPKPFPDESGYTSPGLGLNPQLPGAPQVQPDFNQLNTYGPQQQSAIPAQMIDANAGLNVGDLRSGIFDEINIPAPELQSVVPEMTPFEAEMALRQQRAAMSGEPPTTAPTPYTGQNGELVDGRMFISGPNQPPGPTRVVNRR